MARFTLSGLISDVRGKLGGTIFSNWKGIQYMRVASSMLGNAQTHEQQYIREQFADSVALWRTMTQIQKAEWEEYAQSLGSASSSEAQVGLKSIIPRKSRIQSGMNAFIGANQMVLRAGYPRRVLTPIQPNPAGVDFSTVTATPGTGYTIGLLKPEHCKPGAMTKAVIWQKLDRAGAHAHIIGMTDVTDECPAIPVGQDMIVDKVRVGTGHTVEEVPIADLLPISMWVQMVVVSSDGQKGVFSELFYLNLV